MFVLALAIYFPASLKIQYYCGKKKKMSYKLYSTNSGEAHDLKQWDARSIEGELRGFKNRILTNKFEQYFRGKKYRIMEGGCGFGAWCEWLEGMGQESVGIEYDERIVNKAKELKANVPVELGNILNLNYPDNSFDVYISLGVIEHFENGPEPALIEAKRILKPGGLAFITTPYLSGLRRMISHPVRSIYFFFRKLTGKQSYFWEYRFTDKELENYITNAGFEIIEATIDDYEQHEKNRHIGLWADWFFLRNKSREMWELNSLGKLVLKVMKLFSPKLYCSGWLVIARAVK
jgi:SAM-dependent methyltransferase